MNGVNPGNRQVEVHDEAGAVTIYANNVSIEASSFDVKFRLGLAQTSTPEQVNVKDLAHVYMSHDHFKAFVQVLNTVAANIEAAKQPPAQPARQFLRQ